jgi:hypothetical protein
VPSANKIKNVMAQLAAKYGEDAIDIIKEECPPLAVTIENPPIDNCYGQCRRCNAIDGHGASLQIARLLNRMHLAFGNGADEIIEKACPNLTVCPECMVDDFCHCVDDNGNECCEVGRYAFSDLELAAGNAGCNDWQTETKDTARWQAQEWLVKHGYLSEEDDDADEITEDDVAELCERLMFRFDAKGNMVFPK